MTSSYMILYPVPVKCSPVVANHVSQCRKRRRGGRTIGQQGRQKLVRRRISRAGQRLASFPSCMAHKQSPEIDDWQTERPSNVAARIRVYFRIACRPAGCVEPFRSIKVLQLIFIDRCRCDENDLWVLCLGQWVFQDGLEVFFVLFQRDMLAIRGQHCIVSAEEYRLDSVSLVELKNWSFFLKKNR